MAYQNMVPALVEAVKTLHTELEACQKQLATQQRQIEALRASRK